MRAASAPADSTRPFRIAIVGGGTAGWMCAAGLRNGLPPGDYGLTLVESQEIGTVGVGEATLPTLKPFNDGLGLGEARLMSTCGATFKLGIRFCDWERTGRQYYHLFGAFGEPWGGIDFQHHWLRAERNGHCEPLEAYSFAAAMAEANAFTLPEQEPRSIRSTFSYAYHLDAGLYAGLLRDWATARGVRRIEGRVLDIRRDAESGEIEEIVLKSGERLAADLFIDCTGFRASLLGGALGVAWEDWSHWLPCDRAWAVSCRHGGPITPYTRATARPEGWTWRIPLRHRVGNGLVFCSRFTPEAEARGTLLAALEAPALGDPHLLRFTTGRRDRAWSHNCVAIGLSAGFLEPLESTGIFLIQAAVADLVRLIPRPGAGRSDPRLAAEYNRLARWQYERVRDFLVLHYAANRRCGEPLWDYTRTMGLPESLDHRMRLFRARAHLPNYRFGLFSRDSWLAVLQGQGVLAEAYDPLAQAQPRAALEEKLRAIRERILRGVRGLPEHGAFLERYCRTAGDGAKGVGA
jgi:tryptophan halogenase